MSDYDWKADAHPDDLVDFDVDLGCGTISKAQIGIDRYAAPCVTYVIDLDDPNVQLPFDTDGVGSIITHHCFEHLGAGFIPLMAECWRVLRHDGLLRVIVPGFPGKSALEDPDHKRVFAYDTFLAFTGTPGVTPQNCWLASFSVPYVGASRFEMTDRQITPRNYLVEAFEQVRELRVSLRARKR